ncbi:MAG: hypothetical protein M1832_005471 [Thelocarpon impressellum]|nr:MAG: hypothetical protein M1832_005471 [Thelocarpon impressellum]
MDTQAVQFIGDFPGIHFDERDLLGQDAYNSFAAFGGEFTDGRDPSESPGSIYIGDMLLPKPSQVQEPNSMQRFINCQDKTTFVSAMYPRMAHDSYRLDVSRYAQSPYPELDNTRLDSSGSWFDEPSASERASSSSALSPRTSDGNLASGDPMQPHSLEHNMSDCASLPHGIIGMAYSTGFHREFDNPGGLLGDSFVDPREVQQHPNTTEEMFPVDTRMEHHGEPDIFAPLRLLTSNVALSHDTDEGLGTSIDDSVNGKEEEPSLMVPAQETPPQKSRNASNLARRPPRDASFKPNKVTKRGRTKPTLACKEHPEKSFKNASELKKHIQTAHTRPFRCIFARYGCDATFGSKNEWKRHVNSQHLCLGFWRCDEGACGADEARPHVFNRKDLFTQHLRRMHCPVKKGERAGPEQHRWDAWLDATRGRCYVVRRAPPPASACPFCDQVFAGAGSWDHRMEHVGRHFECGAAGPGQEDVPLAKWLFAEGLIVLDPATGALVATRGAAEEDGFAGADAEGEDVDD